MFYTRISSYLLFTLLLLASLLASCTDKPTIHLLDEDAIVLAFGDSLTYGTGAPVGRSYPDVLATILNRRVINAGVPGEVSSAGLNRLPGLLDQHRPSLVILCHGGNDFLRRGRPELVKNNLHKMIKLSRDAGAEVILIGVPNFNLLMETHPLYEELADNLSVPFDGEIIEHLLSSRSLKSDQIHPNAQGYRLLAEAVAKQFK
jgi:lysophospholipase L1-like esterase